MVNATAEDTTLPPNSVDAITVASAFHWFNVDDFLRECNRILKPNVYVFIIYNVRKSENKLSKEQEKICSRYCSTFVSL